MCKGDEHRCTEGSMLVLAKMMTAEVGWVATRVLEVVHSASPQSCPCTCYRVAVLLPIITISKSHLMCARGAQAHLLQKRNDRLTRLSALFQPILNPRRTPFYALMTPPRPSCTGPCAQYAWNRIVFAKLLDGFRVSCSPQVDGDQVEPRCEFRVTRRTCEA